jgi:5'-deoxynucleotidase YfbR-like HD superfamily hydrolase
MNLIKFFSVAQAMASLTRYSQDKLAAPEDVLKHSGFVTLICYFLCLELNSVAKNRDEEIDLADLLPRAIVHDLDEIAVGDISRPTKYYNDETIAMFEKLKLIGIKKVVHELQFTQKVAELVLVDHSTAKQGRVGFIVDVADKAAVVYKLWDECLMRGNLTLIKHAIHLLRGGFIDSLANRVKDHEFNDEQAFYLANVINSLKKTIILVSKKKSNTYGIVDEVLK